MSLTIYYGLKVLDDSLFFSELEQYRQQILESYSNKPLAKAMAISFFDQENLFETKKYIDPTSEFIKKYTIDFEKNKEVRLLPYSNEFDLTISYFPKEKLIIPYFENNDHYNNLLNFSSLKEYGYWNNTDEPNDIPTKEWIMRSVDWRNATSPKNYHTTYGYKNAIQITVFREKIDIVDFENTYCDIAYESFKQYIKHNLKNSIIKTHGNHENKQLYDLANTNTSLAMKHLPEINKIEKELMHQYYSNDKLELYIYTTYPEILKYKKGR